jgi:uroporphyrinogen-III synthase
LCRMGAKVTEVVAYRTMNSPEAADGSALLPEACRGELDAVVFFSPSAVQGFAKREQGGQLLRAAGTFGHRLAIVAIGEVTAAALRSAGVSRPVQARDTSVDAIVEAMEEFFALALEMGSEGVTGQ